MSSFDYDHYKTTGELPKNEQPIIFIVENSRTGEIHIVSQDDLGSLPAEPKIVHVSYNYVDMALAGFIMFCVGFFSGWMI